MDKPVEFLRELADLIEKYSDKDIVPPQITLNGVKQIPGMEVKPLPLPASSQPQVGFVHRVPQQPLWNGEVFHLPVVENRNVYDDGHKTVCTDSDQCRGK